MSRFHNQHDLFMATNVETIRSEIDVSECIGTLNFIPLFLGEVITLHVQSLIINFNHIALQSVVYHLS
jgi:hypothetical protein